MDNQAIYTRTDSGLNQFYAKIYSLVGMGIGLSAFVSYLMLYPFRANLISIIGAHPWVYYGATIIELILVFVSSSAAQKNTPAALPLFLTFSALNGFTLSFIIAAYAQTTVLQAFYLQLRYSLQWLLLALKLKKTCQGFVKL